MVKKYRGREWSWWLSLNSHECRFCHDEYLKLASFSQGSQRFNDMHLGIQTGRKQAQKGYWNSLYQVWLKHMKQYHSEILAEGTSQR